jgi:hypothetical protein
MEKFIHRGTGEKMKVLLFQKHLRKRISSARQLFMGYAFG